MYTSHCYATGSGLEGLRATVIKLTFSIPGLPVACQCSYFFLLQYCFILYMGLSTVNSNFLKSRINCY